MLRPYIGSYVGAKHWRRGSLRLRPKFRFANASPFFTSERGGLTPHGFANSLLETHCDRRRRAFSAYPLGSPPTLREGLRPTRAFIVDRDSQHLRFFFSRKEETGEDNAIKKALDKYQFKLYALCIMSNHVHYLIEPAQSEDLPTNP
jgi:hypothetical protein